ncbi:MAG: prepilin peptidase [Planctomycetia bacterium]|nr:prepilin peptidase [Planctomycetia bacterium]
MTAWPADATVGAAAATLGGAIGGAVVGRAVPWLMRAEMGPAEVGDTGVADAPVIRPVPWWGPVGIGALAALGLWWWEVVCRGQLPFTEGATSPVARGVYVRLAGHAILLTLVAAASWIDFRLRVIPDAITLPGVLAGMLVAWLVPEQFLPVAVEVPRSFAVPLLRADVLGASGGLDGTPLPAWLGALPEWWGLVTMVTIVAAWWWVCTPGGYGPRIERARWLLGVALVVAMGLAWRAGGRHHAGLVAALVGIAAGGGLVWATRAGAGLALGREAMGLGDVTLMAMIGAWLGWQAAVITFFLGVFLGVGFAALWQIVKRDPEMPFGPFLGLGAAATVVAWRPLWGAVGPWFDRPAELFAVLVLVVLLTAVALGVLRWWRGLRA